MTELVDWKERFSIPFTSYRHANPNNIHTTRPTFRIICIFFVFYLCRFFSFAEQLFYWTCSKKTCKYQLITTVWISDMELCLPTFFSYSQNIGALLKREKKEYQTFKTEFSLSETKAIASNIHVMEKTKRMSQKQC